MIASYRGLAGPQIQQDDIYDSGKSTPPEIAGSMILETHGVGMYDTPPQALEVQAAFAWSVGPGGLPIIQNDSAGGANTPLTYAAVMHYINEGRPILWCDHNGFPVNESPNLPPSGDRLYMGHVKVIAGYDDNSTPGNPADDWYLIYDPWPEYNDLGLKPLNSKKGPGGTWDPYWFQAKLVLDPQDIYLVDSFADIPEFSMLFVPIVAVVAIFIVFRRMKREGKK